MLVNLTDRERLEIGRDLLGIKDGPRRRKALAEFKRFLDAFASDLANAHLMKLNSDFIAATRPLIRAAHRFEASIRAADSDVLALMQYFKYVDLEVLFGQLAGFDQFLGWLKKDPSPRGGERRSYVRRQKIVIGHVFENWFQRNHGWKASEDIPKAKGKFAREAIKLIERALREDKAMVANSDKK